MSDSAPDDNASQTESEPASDGVPDVGLKIFRALRNPNFRDYYLGQAVSLTGTWMQNFALAWLVWRTTHSTRLQGGIVFAGQIPFLFMAPVAGMVADRFPRRTVVNLMQVLGLVQGLALALVVALHYDDFWILASFAFALGVIVSVDMPARQSLVVELVEHEDLPNAIALNALLFNIARFVAPPVTGFLLFRFPNREFVFFAVNGLSYTYLIWLLGRMKLRDRTPPEMAGGMIGGMAEGVAFVRSHPALLYLLLHVAVISFFGLPHIVLLPAVAAEVFGAENPKIYSYLMAASGFGALAGALTMARFSFEPRSFRVIPIGGAAFALAIAAFTFSETLWLSIALLAPVGFAMMMQTVGASTFIHRLVPDRLRGRLSSLLTLAFLGMFPLGSLLMGEIAERIDTLPTIRLATIFCLASAGMLLLMQDRIRESVDELMAGD